MAISSSLLYSLLFISCLVLSATKAESQAKPPIVNGLSWTFYESSCPGVESMVTKHLKSVFKKDIGQAPALLRIFFHDCFVQGCDGSILLDAIAPSNQSERDSRSNGGIRTEALKTIDDIRELVHKKCGRVVSCADIVALAGRDAVVLTGGPSFPVPLGRRDSLTLNFDETSNLPSPFANTTGTIKTFDDQKFDVTDVVALSGAHTFGRSHCNSFSDRVSGTSPAPIDQTLLKNLKATCPSASSPNTANLDIRTPNKFDNKYYIDLMNRQGVFTSDQDLFSDGRTKKLVQSFALDEKLFFEKFTNAMIKMSQLRVLTGKQGEIRAKCNLRNSGKKSMLASVVEKAVEMAEQF
ncbi:peroxidase 12 [Neltuma alba]|uniref:peroxidase 12 n=1 Tax=Neltuma alba TaxID=207710 RepID=UPI0010A3C881|nr:peroxidase 12-like [Prosopis alba]